MDVLSRNHMRVTGRAGGPVVLLAHSFGCDQNMLRLAVPALERDFTPVLFDHVGSESLQLETAAAIEAFTGTAR